MADHLERVLTAVEQIGIIGVQVFDAIRAKILQTVQVAAPAVFQQFSLALRDLTGTIGQILAPVLAKATSLVRGLADAIINLSDGTKKAIQVTLTFVGALTLAGSVIPRVVAAFRLFQGAALALGVRLGPLAAVLAVVAAVVAAFATDAGRLSGPLRAVGDALALLVDSLGALLQAAAPLVGAILEVATAVVNALAPLLAIMIERVAVLAQVLTPLVGILSALAPVFAAVVEMVAVLVEALAPLAALVALVAELFAAVLIPIMEGVAAIVKVLADIFVPIIEAVVNAIKSLVEWFLKVINFFRRLVGLSAVGVPERERERRSSFGAGGRTASFVSGEEIQRRAILAAIQAGRGRDPAEATRELARQQASEAQRAERQRQEMIRAMREGKGSDGRKWEEDRAKR